MVDAAWPDAYPFSGPRRIAILMIGDGMGRGQLAGAGLYAHGAAGSLAIEALPVHGELRSASLSGITDSAAAATLMATGAWTTNGRLGVDRDLVPVENLVELAHRYGLPSGIVSTSTVNHATPAAFTAHQERRGDYGSIAADQATGVTAAVLLGGGVTDFTTPAPNRSPLDRLLDRGYATPRTAAELETVVTDGATQIVGLFAPGHLAYTLDRPSDTTEPTLAQMTTAALTALDASPRGFFLMVEGSRIDMASHGNDAPRALTETIAFDDAVALVRAWAEAHPDDEITLLVTADHETGGLEILGGGGVGVVPDVSWRSGQHSNDRIDVYGWGQHAALFDGATLHHGWIHAALAATVRGEAPVPPTAPLVPDGALGDLRWRVATQAVATGFGAGFNQLDALWLDADASGLAIGVEGLFQRQRNAVLALLDVDPAAGTGPAQLAGAVTDTDGALDRVIAASRLTAPAAAFGIDYVVGARGGVEAQVESRSAEAGLRALGAPQGSPGDLAWLGAAINFGEGVRPRADPVASVGGEGWEVHVPWVQLYPALDGRVPYGARVNLAVVLVNDDGSFTSNQALPPFPAETANPGDALTALPGIVSFVVDSDLDGYGDAASMTGVRTRADDRGHGAPPRSGVSIRRDPGTARDLGDATPRPTSRHGGSADAVE